MSAEQMNKITLMSAEDKNVAVAPTIKNVAVAPTIKKVRKPKIECCACNVMYKDSEICRSDYDEAFCYDCYDDEYIRCVQCDEEIQKHKYGEEYWERDGDNYCECCRDDYDADEEENKMSAEPEDKTPIKLNDCKIEKLNEKEPESKIIDNTEMNANTNTNTAPKIVVSAPEEIKHIAEGLERAIMVRKSNHHRNTGNMEVKDELPLFMREGGEEEIEKRRKELETYLKLLNANPQQMIAKHTLVCLNPATIDPNEVGAEQARDIKKWFDTPKTKQEIREWFGCGKHKADGKSWNCGFMGSRWADKKINGRMVRFAFYADKDKKPAHLKHLAYSIVLDASN